MDEPTADLDPLLQNEILYLLKEVNKQGVTIIMASHHLDSVENLCNKVAMVKDGQVHFSGSIEEIKKPFFKDHLTINLRPGSQKEAILEKLKKMPILKIVDQGNRLVIYPSNIEKTVTGLLQFLKEENLYFNDLDVRKPSLNEIFEKINMKRRQ